MKHKPIIATLLLICSMFIAAPACAQSYNADVRVIFEFPDHTTRATTVKRRLGNDIFRRKPLPNDVWVDDYKIDWWVFAALQELDLPFKTITRHKTGGPMETTILRIGEYATGPEGSWVYYVNGIKSRYHISTQLEAGVREIRFVFEPVQPAPNKEDTRRSAPGV